MSAYQSFMTVLGWSLVDSIWQMAVLWAIYYIFTANIQISSAGKHNLILVFTFIGAEWFVYTLIRLINEPVILYGSGFIPVSSSVNFWVYILSLIYVAILFVRSLQYLIRSQGNRMDKIENTFSLELQSFIDRHSRILGITRQVKIYLSDMAETAQTSGFFKPFILIPVSLVTRLSPQQIEAILIHELFHIRRTDYVINILMSFFRRFFFFNPFAQLFNAALERERELACDDSVIAMGYPAVQYAEALFCLEKFRQMQTGFYLAANGNKPWLLMERICRLLGKPNFKRNQFNPIVILSLVISFLLFGLRLPDKSRIESVGNSVSQSSVRASKVASSALKFTQFEKTAIIRILKKRRSEKVRTILVNKLPLVSGQITSVSSVPVLNSYFVSDKVERNFSNQQAATAGQAEINSTPQTPYLPSVTMSYQAVPEIIWQDSIRQAVVQNDYNDLKNQNLIKAIANLQMLESEIEQNSEQLKLIEIQNRNLIRLDLKNVKPILDNINRQIKLKKRKIEQLKFDLEVSEEEIIHI
jgi:Zn-dependent protease with chaperone function